MPAGKQEFLLSLLNTVSVRWINRITGSPGLLTLRRYADEYDIHFIFDDKTVNIDFFTVPWIDIMAWDSDDGYIGTVGGTTDIESDLPICYIDKDRKTYLIAADLKKFLENCKNWKSELKLCEEIEIFPSKEEANKKYTFITYNSPG